MGLGGNVGVWKIGVGVWKIEVGLGGNVGVWKIGVGLGKFEVGLGTMVWIGVGVGGAVSPTVGVGTGVAVALLGGTGVGGGVPAVGVGGNGKEVGVATGEVGDKTGSDVAVGTGLVTLFESFSHAQQPATLRRAARIPILRSTFLTVPASLLVRRSKSRAGYKLDF